MFQFRAGLVIQTVNRAWQEYNLRIFETIYTSFVPPLKHIVLQEARVI